MPEPKIIRVDEPSYEAMQQKYNLFPAKYDLIGRRKGGSWSDHDDRAVHIDYVEPLDLVKAKDIAVIEGADKIYVHIVRPRPNWGIKAPRL